MPRPLRFFLPHYPHHIRQRGVRKDAVFHDDSDRLVYIRALKDGCTKHGVSIWAYTLMTNHVHLIAVPENEKSISLTLHDAHTDYSMYFNAKYAFFGHVWQGRPDFSAMDDPHMWNAVRYVERNPVRAGLVKRAEDYLWSSAAAHCGLRDDILLSDDFPPPGVIADWSDWLKIDHTDDEKRTIRQHLSTGRPWCTPELIVQLETITGRRLQPGRPGRRKKPPDHNAPSLFNSGSDG